MEFPLTEHIKKEGGFLSLEEYEKRGGYQALRKALQMTPSAIIDQVSLSGLKGRGGAGFPTGQKWSMVPVDGEGTMVKYFIANADEMEPGAFKDRFLLERNPHQLIEGIIIGSFAIQATRGFVFLRRAYHLAEKLLKQALAEAYHAGYWGKNILGSGYDLEMDIHISMGRYICGEETALINALEGKRAIPRAKPPYPVVSGLFGKPTIVNNVETLVNIPPIIEKGGAWFKGLSLTEEGGTKLYGASGRVKQPGLWELPLGTPLRELIEVHAGGMQEGYKFRAVIPGGGSTDFLLEDQLDVAMDYGSVAKAGSRLGTGTLILLDDRTCPVGMVRNLEHFFAQESCGWCTPCREGLPWTVRILNALETGKGTMEQLEILAFHTQYLKPGNTFCALAPGAMEPLQSALKYFKEDFEKHVHEHKCPWKL